MGLMEDVFKGNLGTSLAIGLAATIIGPVVIPIVGRAVKPVVKAAIKGGMRMYGAGIAAVSSTGECLSDLFAEARSEVEQEHSPGLEHTPPPCGPNPAPGSPL